MNTKPKSLFFACLFLVLTTNSQIKGKCIDELGKVIPYVNISIKGKSIGTVSNLKGYFSFKNLDIKENDSLIFSHLNFEKKTVRIPLKINEIQLKSKVENLGEIIIYNKKRKSKEKVVGTKTKSGNVVLFFISKNLGTEIGKIIKIKKNKVYELKNIQFNITDFGYKSATFRINFYNIIDGNIDLIKTNGTDNIIKITKKGMVKFDLSNQYLTFENDFLASIEWIDLKKDETIEKENRVIDFSSTVFSGPFISRDNVNLKWRNKKLKYNIGLGIHLKVEKYSE
jgi:hypothetical protein